MKIKKQAYIIFLIIIAGLLYLVGQVLIGQVQTTDTNLSDIKEISIGDEEIYVEVVESISDRSLGLSGRESLDENSGMFFVFESNDYHGFWMKGMLFPIDIIWVNEDFEIVDVTKSATPDSFPDVFRPQVPSRYVLEVNGGFFEQKGLAIGDVVMFGTDI